MYTLTDAELKEELQGRINAANDVLYVSREALKGKKVKIICLQEAINSLLDQIESTEAHVSLLKALMEDL